MIEEHTPGQLHLLVAGTVYLDKEREKAFKEVERRAKRGLPPEEPPAVRPKIDFKKMTGQQYMDYCDQHGIMTR